MTRKWGDICNLWKVWELSIIALIAAMPSLALAEAVLTSQAYVDAKIQAQGQTSGSILSSSSPDDVAPSSKAVYTALQSAVGSIDGLPTGSSNDVLQYTNSAWTATSMDTTPTQSSVKPVTSGGVKTYVDSAVATKQDKIPANSATFMGGIDVPGLVATTDSAGTVGEVGMFTVLAASMNDQTAYAEQAAELFGSSDSTAVAELASLDSVVPSYAMLIVETESKQDKIAGNSEVNGKVVTASSTPGAITYTTVDNAPSATPGNLVSSVGVYNAVNGKVDIAQGSANAGKGLIVDSSGDLALANILQAINSATNNLTSGDGYVVKAVTLNSDNKTVDVTRDTVKLPVSSGAPSSNTPSGFAEIWVQ